MTLDAAGLRDLISERLEGSAIVVVSNREPYVHSRAGDEISWSAPASGLVTALESVMRAAGGTWVAHGSGDADHDVVDARSRVRVPPGEERYCLKRVWISKAEEEAYYYGFANQALWPLCHHVYTRPRFDCQHWRVYREVNEKFAAAVLEEIGQRPTWVFVQDYHFALLPRLLKEARPDLTVAQFWHIPWPSPEIFEICPWGNDILDGLLGNDLLGFHTRQHCDNFQASVERMGGTVEQCKGVVAHRQHRTAVRPFPISVDFDALSQAAESAPVRAADARLRSELGLSGMRVAVGVDRVDYTKGIAERFLAVDRFLTKYPSYRRRFVMLQIGPLSRVLIDEYRQLNDELYRLVNLINRRHSEDAWSPIRLLKANYARDAVLAFFRTADICMVSSLHDGMNLVAKEFVSARVDGEAALLLSRFAGAASELSEAILVNPYDTESFADAIKDALELPSAEKRARMQAMRQAVAANNIYDWAARIVAEVGCLR